MSALPGRQRVSTASPVPERGRRCPSLEPEASPAKAPRASSGVRLRRTGSQTASMYGATRWRLRSSRQRVEHQAHARSGPPRGVRSPPSNRIDGNSAASPSAGRSQTPARPGGEAASAVRASGRPPPATRERPRARAPRLTWDGVSRRNDERRARSPVPRPRAIASALLRSSASATHAVHGGSVAAQPTGQRRGTGRRRPRRVVPSVRPRSQPAGYLLPAGRIIARYCRWLRRQRSLRPHWPCDEVPRRLPGRTGHQDARRSPAVQFRNRVSRRKQGARPAAARCGVHISAGDPASTDTFVKTDITPKPASSSKTTAAGACGTHSTRIHDAGGALIYVLGIGIGHDAKREDGNQGRSSPTCRTSRWRSCSAGRSAPSSAVADQGARAAVPALLQPTPTRS